MEWLIEDFRNDPSVGRVTAFDHEWKREDSTLLPDDPTQIGHIFGDEHLVAQESLVHRKLEIFRPQRRGEIHSNTVNPE